MTELHTTSWKARPIIMAALACVLLTTPVAAKKMRPVYPIEEIREVAPNTKILVLPPLVRLERLAGSNKAVSDSDYDVAVWIQKLAVDGLAGRGFDSVSSADNGVATRKLQTVADQYVRNRRGPDATVELVRLAAHETDRTAVLVQFLEVQLGSRGYWNSGSGALGVGMSNSNLHSVLLDASTGELLWRGELYYRDIPDIDSRKWDAAITDMYSTLIYGREER